MVCHTLLLSITFCHSIMYLAHIQMVAAVFLLTMICYEPARREWGGGGWKTELQRKFLFVKPETYE